MVDDFVGAICLTFNLVLVIPASGDIPLQNSIPLENGKLCVPANLLLGLAVNLINRHLYRPFIVLHLVVVATVGGNSNRLVATQSAGRGIEAVRNGDFIVAKRNICKLCPRRGDGSIYHTLCFVFQLVDGCIFGSLGSDIRFSLAGERSFLPAECAGAGLGHLIMYCPCSRTIAAIEVEAIILRVAACGNGLRSGRGHLPTAAVHAAAGLTGHDSNDCAIHFFQRVQLVFVGVDGERQIKAAAGALCRSGPRSRIILRLRSSRYVRDFGTASNFLTNQCYNLPCVASRRIINVSVITVFAGLNCRAVCQFFSGSDIGLCSITIRIVGNDPLLGFIVDFADEGGLFIVCAHNSGLAVQHIETQLTEATPNVDLVRIMVAGGVLTGLKARHMIKSVGRTAIGLTVQTMAATIGFLAVEPNKPSAALFGDAGDFAGGIGRGRTGCEGCNTIIGIKLRRSCFIRQLYMNRFL